MIKSKLSKNMIDNINLRILFELNQNCRQTNAQLGKKCRVSKQVIKYRIDLLEKSKLIKSYHALIDWRKLGYNSIRIYLKWHNIDLNKENEIYNYMKSNSLFMWTVKFEGDFDVGFYVWVKTVNDFSKMWFDFLKKYRSFILKQEIYESVEQIHYSMNVLYDNKDYSEKIVGQGNLELIDDVDYKLLELLTEDASKSIVELAKNVKLTPKSVIYRIKALEKKKIILGYNALIDTDKLGYSFYKLDFYLNSLDNLDQYHLFAKQNPLIVYRMRTIGGPDFEIEVMVEDVIELNNLINKIKEKFGKEIDYYRIHRFEYTIKQIYFPTNKSK
jgi:DNA-binding Lrp family transcriptional regulator